MEQIGGQNDKIKEILSNQMILDNHESNKEESQANKEAREFQVE